MGGTIPGDGQLMEPPRHRCGLAGQVQHGLGEAGAAGTDRWRRCGWYAMLARLPPQRPPDGGLFNAEPRLQLAAAAGP